MQTLTNVKYGQNQKEPHYAQIQYLQKAFILIASSLSHLTRIFTWIAVFSIQQLENVHHFFSRHLHIIGLCQPKKKNRRRAKLKYEAFLLSIVLIILGIMTNFEIYPYLWLMLLLFFGWIKWKYVEPKMDQPCMEPHNIHSYKRG